jgi:hypothetical protein
MEIGITEEEIGAVQANVMLVSAGRVSAQFGKARIEAKKEARKRSGSDVKSGERS